MCIENHLLENIALDTSNLIAKARFFFLDKSEL
jgi:hypothetical protein